MRVLALLLVALAGLGCDHEPELVIARASLVDDASPYVVFAVVDAGPAPVLSRDERDKQIEQEYTTETAAQRAEELDETIDDDAVIDLKNRFDLTVGSYFSREPFEMDRWWRQWAARDDGAGGV